MRGSMTKRSMGELERAVMDILWDQGGWLTPGEVHQRLQDPPAYPTVMTILVRLCTKGRVERHRDGRAYAYHPVVSRVLDSMDPADRAQLRRLLNRYRSP